MPEFNVTWEIEVDAEDHEAAARKALAQLRDPDTIADVFEVTPTIPGVTSRKIDLSAIDGRCID